MEELLLRAGLEPALVAALHLPALERLLLAAVLGAAVGAERELSGKSAGLRTNLLICMGAALVTLMSTTLAARAGGDPARMAAQIVSGIGFMGAGTIMQSRGRVLGLTTAATLWVVAAIGIAAGAGAYIEAAGSALLVVLVLFGLRRLEEVINRRRVRRRYRVLVTDEEGAIDHVVTALRQVGLAPQLEGVERRPDTLEIHLRVDGPDSRHAEAIRTLVARPSVRRAHRS